MNKVAIVFAILGLIAIGIAMVCTVRAAMTGEMIYSDLHASGFITAALLFGGLSFLIRKKR